MASKSCGGSSGDRLDDRHRHRPTFSHLRCPGLQMSPEWRSTGEIVWAVKLEGSFEMNGSGSKLAWSGERAVNLNVGTCILARIKALTHMNTARRWRTYTRWKR